jgi:hypothetical protein
MDFVDYCRHCSFDVYFCCLGSQNTIDSAMPRTEDQKKMRRVSDAIYRAKNRDMIREYLRTWKMENPEKDAQYSRNRRRENPAATRLERERYRAKNPHLQSEISKRYVVKNRDKINARERDRCAKDMAYRLSRNLRNQLRYKLRAQIAGKAASALALVGCDIKFLMGYLEAKFQTGMKWSNYGSVWEIDHRIPCASFDLSDESHQRSCFHYTNLQPLFVSDNRRKWSKISP